MISKRTSNMNRGLPLVVAGLMMATAACSSSSNNTVDAGGGGRGGTGGGSGGGGGRAQTGGNGGAGVGSGGTAVAGRGAGGAAAAGGAGGAGGTLQACASPPYTHVSTFGAIFDGWLIALNSTAELVPMPGVGPDGGFSGSLLELDTADGSPVNGSAKLTIPFSQPGQQILFSHQYAGVNMAGTTITAQIKLDSGLITSPTDVGQAFLVLKSTSGYLYAPGPDIALDPSAGWVTLSISADAPSASVPVGYTPCDIREIDVVIQTGNTGTYRQAVVHIDTIAITGPASADGGASDAPDDTSSTGGAGGRGGAAAGTGGSAGAGGAPGAGGAAGAGGAGGA